MSNEHLRGVFGLNPIDPDLRRRISGNVIDLANNPVLNGTNAMRFSLYVDSLTGFAGTVDTVIPYSRTDTGVSPVTLALYVRTVALGSVTLANTPFLEGGINRTGNPVNAVQSETSLIAKNTVCDANYIGINGWKLAGVTYGLERKSGDDLLAGKRPAPSGYTPATPVIQWALVCVSNDATIVVNAHVHYDLVEVVQ